MSREISSTMKEDRVFTPCDAFRANAWISSREQYDAMYRESVEDPEGFWARMATEHLHWRKKFDRVLRYDFNTIGTEKAPYVEWFGGGTLNISENCLDRHVAAGLGNKVAIHWQGEQEDNTRSLTYADLLQQTCRFANALRAQGVKKGDRVTLYLPMIPEAVVALQACARIGAVHSVVFSAFSPESLRNRINDCGSTLVITTDVSYHAGKVGSLKAKVDEALEGCPTVGRVVVLRRADAPVAMTEGRDVFWSDAVEGQSSECVPEEMNSEDPLFILYTSGSTGKPKGVLHTTAGYLLFVHLTMRYVFDIHPDDVFWCTADVGWITGHSYLAYGPTSNAATQIMYESVPTYPEADRFWKICAKFKATVFYTAPTAIRALMRLGEELPARHDLSRLRLLGSVGEPINPEAWMWYHRVIGQGRCPITDTWWQTETGGHMLLTIPGASAAKPGAAGLPFFGVVPKILRTDGAEAETNEGGSLVITHPWPGMIRGVFGDEKNELIRNVYFSAFPGVYFSGDGCRRDEDGYYWLLGRMDDVINVSGHRLATAEFESSLVGHPSVAEAAVVGYPHDIKGQGVYCYVTLKQGYDADDALREALIKKVRSDIGPIAKPDKIHFTPALPKTRSGKIMRRILRKIAEGDLASIGDTSTLADPSVVDALVTGRQ